MSKEYFTIQSSNISKYVIVYDTRNKNCGINKTAAEILRHSICLVTNVAIPVVSDSTANNGEYKIFIGESFSSSSMDIKSHVVKNMCYDVYASGGNLFIQGGGLLSVRLIVEKIANEILESSQNIGDIRIALEKGSLLEEEKVPLTSGAEFRLMTYNILAEWESWGGGYMPVEQRLEGFRAVFDVYSPDVVGLQEVSDIWSEKLAVILKEEYGFINRRTPDDLFYNLCTIVYKKSRFSLVDSGLQYFSYNGPNIIRLVNWGILEDKNTNKRFVIFNTHWMWAYPDGRDDERRSHILDNIKIINQKMDSLDDVKMCFATADYNSTLDYDYMQKFLRETGLVNTRDLAKDSGTLINNPVGLGDPGIPKTDANPEKAIDHIFCKPFVDVLRHETIITNKVEHVSDHCPKYVDVVLK